MRLIEPLLKERAFFLISLTVSKTNLIKLVIDHNEGVKLEDCIAFSRAIEHNLDREIEDF